MTFKLVYLFLSILIKTIAISANGNTIPVSHDKPILVQNWNHPVHISFTNIDYLPEKGRFEILFKFFVDDFDLILFNKYGKNLDLTGGRWEKSYIETINQYVFEHFKLLVGGKDKTKSSLKFSKHEFTEESISLYYSFNVKDKNNTFEVHNTFLTDLFLDQSNLLIFTYLENQKAVKFDRFKTSEPFIF
jgi:hypothetical protein